MAQSSIDFYAGILGLRMVKATVNLDDPTTHHLYFGDAKGSPGSLLTVFAWPRSLPGQTGRGTASPILFATRPEALSFWRRRLSELGYTPVCTHRFGDPVIRFQAHDLLSLGIVPSNDGTATPWIPAQPFESHNVLRGLHSITLPTPDIDATTAFFTDVFGWSIVAEHRGMRRLQAPTQRSLQSPRTPPGCYVDLSSRIPPNNGYNGPGVVHHVAFRVADADAQRAWREHLLSEGLEVSPVRDRVYFKSIYFRSPTRTAGILFEIATDGPGFTVDEPYETLGATLRLPDQVDSSRLADTLPALDRTVLSNPPTPNADMNPPTA